MDQENALRLKKLLLQISDVSKDIVVLQERRIELLNKVKYIIPVKMKLLQ